MTATPHLQVVCALIVRNNQLLVAQRSADSHQALRWELPGGKLEPGESAEAAIRREILEELGCRVRPIRRLQTHEHSYETFSITLIPFVCELDNDEPRALEHAALRWCNAAELETLDWAAADLPIVEAFAHDL